MRQLTALPCASVQAGSLELHQPFFCSPHRVDCSSSCASISSFLPSDREPQTPSKASVHIPTKFFPFLCQAADFFQPWLRGTFGLQVLIPEQIVPKALLAVGGECIPALGSCRVSFNCLAKGSALSLGPTVQCGPPSHQ